MLLLLRIRPNDEILIWSEIFLWRERQTVNWPGISRRLDVPLVIVLNDIALTTCRTSLNYYK